MHILTLFAYFRGNTWETFLKKYEDETEIKIRLSSVIDAFISKELEIIEAENSIEKISKEVKL